MNNSRILAIPMLFLISVLGVSLACNLPGAATESPPLDDGAAHTAAARTIEAQRMQNTMQAQQVMLTSQAQTLEAPPATTVPSPEIPVGPSFTPINTLLASTFTPVPSLTPGFPTATETPSVPIIVATIDTNCRIGPSKLYERVGYLMAGQQSTVHGRNDANTWWYIANPTKAGEYCWVWGETTTVSGNVAGLPVITPPALPKVAEFALTFSNLHICGGVAYLVFRVENTGTESFWSSNIFIRNLSTNEGFSGPELSNTPFMKSPNACPPGIGELKLDEVAYVAKGIGMMLDSGTKMRGVVALCTEPDLGGTCIEQKVNFDFP